MKYEILSHPSETGIKAYGRNIDEAFANTAEAMFSIITDLNKVSKKEKTTIKVESKDKKDLLVDWLNELIYFFETKGLLLGGFDVRIQDSSLIATVEGERFEEEKHTIRTQIKAATYFNLSVEEGNNSRVQVFLDV